MKVFKKEYLQTIITVVAFLILLFMVLYLGFFQMIGEYWLNPPAGADRKVGF